MTLQHSQVAAVTDGDVQMEDDAAVVSHQGSCGARGQETVEAQSALDHAHARQTSSIHLGSRGIRQTAVLQPRVYPLALGMPVEVEIDEEHPAPQGAQRRSPSTRRR